MRKVKKGAREGKTTATLFEETEKAPISNEIGACFLKNDPELDRAGYLTGAEASCTDVDMARRTVHHSLNALYIRLPASVGTSV